jgi:hypothetical protein
MQSDIIKFLEDPATGPWLNVLKLITKVNMYTAVLIMAIIICHFQMHLPQNHQTCKLGIYYFFYCVVFNDTFNC